MPILSDQWKFCTEVSASIAGDLDCSKISGDTTLWHYTTGEALIAIVKEQRIFSTYISCLNDSSEMRYAATHMVEAFSKLGEQPKYDQQSKDFIGRAIKHFQEDVEHPEQTEFPFYVTCFSAAKDDLSQWRAYSGGENGYAIGFKANDLRNIPSGLLFRVNYGRSEHELVASKIAEAVLNRYNEEISKQPTRSEQWTADYLFTWYSALAKSAPLFKDPAFRDEQEYRIVKQFKDSELNEIEFRQKRNLMSRHIPLRPHSYDVSIEPYKFPIAGVLIGPSRHKHVSQASVEALLRKSGYSPGLVEISNIPFQAT